MKQKEKKWFLGIFLTFLLVTNFAQAQIVETATTKLALDEIKSGLSDIVDDAMNRVDYTVAKAAIEALSVIDAWEKANTNLLNTAFNRLDASTQNMFRSADALVQKTMDKIDNSLETAQNITNDFNQIAESLIVGKGRSFISRYSSPVLSPFITRDKIIEITGVNLDKSDLKVKINGEYIEVPIVGPTKANLTIPFEMIKMARANGSNIIIEVKHLTKDGNKFLFFPRYKEVNRELIFRTLPEQFATYELTGIRKFKKEKKQNYRSDAGRFEGKNKEINKIAKPLEDWQWDLRNGESSRDNFKVVSTGGGEKGRCQKIVWNESSVNGISVNARVDQIKELHKARIKDGYCHCGVEGPIYRMIDASEDMKSISGNLTWSDKYISIPNDVVSWVLKLKLFTGEERIITNSDAAKLFEVIKSNNNIVIKPLEPKGL